MINLHPTKPWVAICVCASVCLPVPGVSQEAISCLLEPARSLSLATPVPGILEEIAVARGDHVDAGQVVARVNSSVERAALAAAEFRAASLAGIRSAEARLAEARRQLAQVNSLAERGVASRNQLAELESEVTIGESIVSEARDAREGARLDVLSAAAALELRNIRAPVSGVILALDADVGEFADPDQPLAELVVVDRLHAEILMPAESYRDVDVSRAIRILDTAGDHGVEGRVLAKDAVIDAASRTFELSVEIDNSEGAFIAGTKCQVRFGE